MPCCVAYLHFAGCRHDKILKLRCTSRTCDAGPCELGLQQRVVTARYRWKCEVCLEEEITRERENMTNGCKDVQEAFNLDETMDPAVQENALWMLDCREHWEKMRFRLNSKPRAQELRSSCDWIENYVRTVTDVLFRWLQPEDIKQTAESTTQAGQNRFNENTQPSPHTWTRPR